MVKNLHKITAILFPTLIITSPVSALDCNLAISAINVSNENIVKIPYEDGFESLLPDSYACPYGGCNVCNFKIKKFDSYYQVPVMGSCTLAGCLYSGDHNNQKLCFKNWMLSDGLSYDDLPLPVNRCINGYRNITYVKKQQKLDKNFSLEESKAPEHTSIALSEGIPACKKLFNFLEEEGRFNEDEISYFSIYLGHRNFQNPYRSSFMTVGEETIKIQKAFFDYLSANFNDNNGIITSEMLEQFEQQYQEYLTHKRANRRRKISQFWNKLLDFIKF